MKKTFSQNLCLALGAGAGLLATMIAPAIPDTYYNSVDTTNATTLRNSLHAIISSGTTVIPFNSNPSGPGGTALSFAALRYINQDGGDPNFVRLFYSKDVRPGEPNVATADGDPTTGGWNREHAYPQSFFDLDGPGGDPPVDPPISDLHALWPADGDINGTRSNKAYDFVPVPTYTDVYGNLSSSGLFEPRDAAKGDAARAALYMDIRYEGTNGEPNLTMGEVNGGTGGLTLGRLSTLLQWHNEDPPDAFEVWRNRRVYELQGNANPFIDNPEWVNIIYGSPAPTVAHGDTLTITATHLAPATIEQDAFNVPLLSINASTLNEFDIAEVDITNIGTLADAGFERVRLFQDKDKSGTVTAGDMLLDEKPFTAGTVTLTSAAPFRVRGGSSEDLLIVVELKPQVALGASVQIRLDAIRHSSRGGNDVDPVFTPVNSSPSTVVSGGINIVAVTVRGSDNSATKEYLTLANHSNSPVLIEGWQLRSRVTTGTSVSTIDLPAGATIPAGGHYTIAHDSYTDINDVEGVQADLFVSSFFGGMGDTSRRSIALFDGPFANARKIDGFSWLNGADVDGGYNDGTAFSGGFSTSTQARNGVIRRIRPGGNTGPYKDTEDNSADLEVFAFPANTAKPPPSDTTASTPFGPPTAVEMWLLF